MTPQAAPLRFSSALGPFTDRKSLLALRGVGPESEAESVCFHGRRVTKVGPGSQTQLPPEGWGPLNKGCERRTWALPDVSGGGERHDRFGVESTMRSGSPLPVCYVSG